MSPLTLALITAFAALVIVLFGLAMTEASLLHLRRSAVAVDALQGDKRSARLLTLVDDLPRVMNAVLLAVLFTQVTATTLAGVLAQRWASGAGITIATVIVTMVLFIYGEAIPKTIAIRNPLHHARRLVPFTRALERSLRPIVAVLVWFADKQAPDAGQPGLANTVTEHELRHITDEAATSGEIGWSDADLIDRSFRVGDMTVSQILVPVDEIISVPKQADIRRALGVALGAGHRRLLVTDTATGHYIGFLRLRDVAAMLPGSPERAVSELILEALHVRSDHTLVDVLRSMQSADCRLALVEDSAGVIVGMVTIEDIVEELMGPINEPLPQHEPPNQDEEPLK